MKWQFPVETDLRYNRNKDESKSKINNCANIVIGDFGESKDVYEIIKLRLDNLADDGFFVYVVNNDFFTDAPKDFKDVVSSKATLVGLIVLPSVFTNQDHIGKSILIGRKGELLDYQMSIIKMDDDLSQENLEMAFVKIFNMFKEIGGK